MSVVGAPMSEGGRAELHYDLDGRWVPVETLAADGHDRDYGKRIPAIREILASGGREERLDACYLLLAWGDPAGYERLEAWCSDADSADRLDGEVFDWLADGITQADPLSADPSVRALRRRGVLALLGIAPRVRMRRNLLYLVSGEPPGPDLDAAIRRAAEAAAERAFREDSPAWAAYQAATLLQLLAAIDDDRAAEIGRKISELRPGALREVAFSLGHGGRGPATLAVLDEFQNCGDEAVAAPARELAARRRAAGP